MGSRLSDARALVKRVENAGWLVSRSRDGWKVSTPKGPITIHTSYSDVNAIENVERRLKAAGLAKLEEQMAVARETARVTRTSKAQAAAFSEVERINKANEEAARAAAVARASGPYLAPEDVKITWFAQPHPAPWMRWVKMTPEIARYLLDNHNDINRPLREARSAHYKNVIMHGDWRQTHQGMAMDSDGKLQDGQHRLKALVDASDELDDEKLWIPVAFFVGMDPANFAAVDEGGNRSPSDLFARGKESYGAVIASVVRLNIAFYAQQPRRAIRERLTNEAIITEFGKDAEEYRTASRFGALNYKKVKMNPGPLGAAYYILRRENGADNRYVEAFIYGLVTGLKTGSRIALDDLDPRAVARSYFVNNRLKGKTVRPIEAVSVVIQAWNNVVEGRTPKNVKFTDDMDVPRVVIMRDSGDQMAVYTAPKALAGEVDE